MTEAKHALGVSRPTLWRACSGRTRMPALVAGYRAFVQKHLAEMTGGEDAVRPIAAVESTGRAPRSGRGAK
jgi:hypothetical protein